MNDRRRSRRLLLWPLLAVVGAYLAGIVVGGLLLAVLSANTASDDAWAGLGNFILSLLVGLCVAVISWVIGLVWVARRLFYPGNRAVVIVSSVAAVIATATVTRLEIGLLDGVGAPQGVTAWALSLLGLLVLAVPSLVFRLWGRRAGPDSGSPAWTDARARPGTMPSDPSGAAHGGSRGPTEWHPEE
ncbi:MAG TPA: hypothetical protein VFC48_08250 [Cellulomonas sp.]|nr:hypothetical protein [Cellulomonas sp.]